MKSNYSYIGYCRIYPQFSDAGTIDGEGTLAFYLAKEYWGRGLATEAGEYFLSWAFKTKKFSRVVACAEEGNLVTKRVLDKLGFRLISK